MSARAVALGYASLDRAVRVGALPTADVTARVLERLSEPWPRPGGCGPGIAHALAQAGVATACVSWVAADAHGRRVRDWLRAADVDDGGVRDTGTRSPEATLLYDPDGGCACLYDPGDAEVDGLDDEQAALVADAHCVCFAVGPAAATRAALELVRADALVAWSVKADPSAFDTGLVDRLLARADVVALSRGERAFVERSARGGPRPGALVVETAGVGGATWRRDGRSGTVPARRVDVRDATGAGDAFVGGLLAGLLADAEDADAAVRRGIDTSAALLAARTEEGTAA